MSFENALVTKALMLGIAFTSITVGIFDVKQYLHLQLVPHISLHHQYWRLFAHHFACANSSDLFLTELFLYNAAIHIERGLGSVKYASFLVLTLVINTIGSFAAQLLLNRFPNVGLISNHIPAGPISMVFTMLYQYFRLIPHAYQFKIFGLGMSDKVWVYAIAAQLLITRIPATILPAAVGIMTGMMYRSDLLQLKSWRISHRLVVQVQTWIKPLLGEDRSVRRTNRVLPDARVTTSGSPAADNSAATQEEPEVVTTAQPGAPTQSSASSPTRAETSSSRSDDAPGSTGRSSSGVVRQWVSELTGAGRPSTTSEGTVRVPTDAEVQLLTGMFPDITREVVLGALQRTPNIEAAAEVLLSSQSQPRI